MHYFRRFVRSHGKLRDTSATPDPKPVHHQLIPTDVFSRDRTVAASNNIIQAEKLEGSSHYKDHMGDAYTWLVDSKCALLPS